MNESGKNQIKIENMNVISKTEISNKEEKNLSDNKNIPFNEYPLNKNNKSFQNKILSPDSLYSVESKHTNEIPQITFENKNDKIINTNKSNIQQFSFVPKLKSKMEKIHNYDKFYIFDENNKFTNIATNSARDHKILGLKLNSNDNENKLDKINSNENSEILFKSSSMNLKSNYPSYIGIDIKSNKFSKKKDKSPESPSKLNTDKIEEKFFPIKNTIDLEITKNKFRDRKIENSTENSTEKLNEMINKRNLEFADADSVTQRHVEKYINIHCKINKNNGEIKESQNQTSKINIKLE